MRIVAVQPEPVARILSITYSIVSVSYFFLFVHSDAQSLTLPLGVVAPMITLNFNLHLPRPSSLAVGMGYFVATILCYAISGWLTGAAGVLCFNWVSKLMGGFDAKFVTTVDDVAPAGNAKVDSTL